MASCPWFGPWITLIAAPAHLPLDPAILLPPVVRAGNDDDDDDIGIGNGIQQQQQQFLGGPEAVSITDPVERHRCVARARNLGARLLGKLASFIMRPMPGIQYTQEMESPLDMLLSKALFRIRIHRIHVFFGLPDPDPLVRGMDPDPALDPDPDLSIIMQK
jgi:TATA-binding protein-associated factor